MNIVHIFSYKKIIILSLRELYFDQIKARTKLYEFRKKFPYDEVVALVYISKTQKQIVGLLELGLPMIDTSEKIAQFAVEHHEGNYDDTLAYLGGNKSGYVMKIDKIYILEQPLSLNFLKQIDNKFTAPQSYSYLREGTPLYHYLTTSELKIREI